MKKLYVLFEYEFDYIKRYVLLLAMISFFLQLFFISRGQGEAQDFVPYETMFIESGAMVVAVLTLILMCGICVRSFNNNFNESKSIYTLMALPQKRSKLLFSKILAWLVGFALIIANQVITGIVGYKMFAPVFNQYIYRERMIEAIITEPMTNGLLLSFVRSDFYRILMPLSLEGFLSSLIICLSIVFGMYYVLVLSKNNQVNHLVGFTVVLIHLIGIINVLRYRIQMPTEFGVAKYQNLYHYNLFFIVIIGFYIIRSVSLINKTTIT
ncbi:hypothetical protein EDC19_0074 [Natranaerovirga hydrolytica]|uniref:ABC-2 family transporter n=1 Tax=Natranaerovirga hydrolytica TaxID=680378 RepID=A0A4R1N1A2_9FIRM|nr:hypothetical protein [Natranaerovirga hydrolytica]TCK99716.1 hypothetical protein EDC19_0074 [Natranaerovirga hydrolytica]